MGIGVEEIFKACSTAKMTCLTFSKTVLSFAFFISRRKDALKLRPIYFSLGSSEIKRSSMPKLHQVLEYLRKYPHVRMRIVGHTDETGTVAGNRALSYERAIAVRRYFIEMGINPNRLEAIGLGSSQPAIKTNDWSLHRFNRRVEFVIRD